MYKVKCLGDLTLIQVYRAAEADATQDHRTWFNAILREVALKHGLRVSPPAQNLGHAIEPSEASLLQDLHNDMLRK
jgi:hypothetical protein